MWDGPIKVHDCKINVKYVNPDVTKSELEGSFNSIEKEKVKPSSEAKQTVEVKQTAEAKEIVRKEKLTAKENDEKEASQLKN